MTKDKITPKSVLAKPERVKTMIEETEKLKVFRFKMFLNEDDFLKWQAEKPRNIMTLSPVAGNLNMDIDASGANANMKIGCMVVYWEFREE